MGAATVWEIVSALAPGYTVEIVIVGGEMSGYCETGRLNEAMTPASVMRIATTVAKIGRSMKKREKLPMGLLRRGLLGAGRLHHRAGAQLHEVVDDHHVALVQSRGDDGVAADPSGGLDVLRRDLVLRAHGHHEARLVALHDGALRHEHAGLLAGEDAKLRELSRHPAVHGIGEFGTQLHCAHARVDGAAGEVELAVVRR